MRAACLAFLAVCGLRAAFAAALHDDAGRTLAFAQPVQRVVSLSPHLTELMYAIGAGDRIVGTVRGSDYPPQAAQLPEVGDSAGLDFERIVDMRPQVVLAWSSGNRAVDIARLRSLGLPVLEFEPRRPEDIGRHLRMLGELTAKPREAESAARSFEQRLAALRDRYGDRPPVRVLFEIWHQPLFTVNREHIISRMLALCGGQNVFEGIARLAGEVSLEQVLVEDPDVIVVGTEAIDAGVGNWAAYGWLKAVRTGNVFAVPADLVTRQTPRMAEAAERLCAGLDRARQ